MQDVVKFLLQSWFFKVDLTGAPESLEDRDDFLADALLWESTSDFFAGAVAGKTSDDGPAPLGAWLLLGGQSARVPPKGGEMLQLQQQQGLDVAPIL